ncbi:hypothetical protein PRZ48_006433 [Zasmidium cellare]|uniref:Enoyl reductase (ER) domain-containing protein n=1 Tax=Zasmidium cellare TaxID=395010 RepID=A0ABR0EP18_ZASCE|nr:hypothetical protein PRZ48_006433 [Zasmidium cellare]
MDSQLPSTMRACQWTTNTTGIENTLHLNPSATLPKNANNLPAGHTLVKVAYTTLNPFDYKVAEAPVLGNYILPKPSIPCLDFSGTVVATKNAELSVGDLVFGRTNPPFFGCLAEYVVVDSAGISKVPKGVSLQDAATAGIAALAAYQSVAPFVKEGSQVFINGGSGGTGTFGIQFAKALGCTVTTTCSTRNIELCKSLGADEVIDYTALKEDLPTALKARGKPFDLIVDNVFADPNLYWHSPSYLIPNGTFSTPGDTKPSSLVNIAMASFLPAWAGGGQRPFVFVRNQPKKADFEAIGKWMAQGKVKAVVEEVIEMADAGKGFGRLKGGRVRGKIVVRVGGD